MIAGFSVGSAYFDAETGLLLYYHTLWGAYKMLFILSEINYDFARQTAFPEDDGPHTGFKSFVSEQSFKQLGIAGGSVIIQSLVENPLWQYHRNAGAFVLFRLNGWIEDCG